MDVLSYRKKNVYYQESLFRSHFFLQIKIFFFKKDVFFKKRCFLSVETVVVGSFKQNECGVRSAQWAYGPHSRTVVVPLIATSGTPLPILHT